ncbi:MAG: insulinase family protein, partial [Acidobacteria bacterium]|nr:insulinase family protein [Acidobacteriota bacterium]
MKLSRHLGIVLLLACACATGQTKQERAAAEGEAAAAKTVEPPLPMDPDVRTGTLDNGLTFYIRKNAKPEQRASMWLAVNAGSVLEDDDQRGLAHFVEHMAFNGTARFEKNTLIDFIEKAGMDFGADLNAFTSFDETVYMLTVPTDREGLLDKGVEILADWARGVAFDDDEIDKERGVVVEEWRLSLGADARLQDQQFPVLFAGSRYAERLPIGKVEILESFPHDALRRFYREWYRPELMAVIAVGDFDKGKVEELIRQTFAGTWGPDVRRPRELSPVPDHEQTLYSIVTDPELTDTTVAVYYKLPKAPQGGREDYRRSLLEGLYHSMLNDRLDEITRRPGAPFLYAFSSGGSLVRSRDVYFQAAGVAEGQVLPGLEALLTEAARVDRHGFTQGELDRAKTDLLRSLEQTYRERDRQPSAAFAAEFTRAVLEGEPIPGIAAELELAREMIPPVTLEEINHLAQDWITEDNRVILVSGPEKEGATLPTEAQLAAAFEAVAAKDIEPYRDRVRDEPLLAQLPEPGPVVETKEIPELGVTEWRLANGARVFLKPTDFKNDEILLQGFSPGGTSLVPDEDFFSAAVATAIEADSGLGGFDPVELDKALAGKVASVSVSLGELEEEVRGNASPEDLETLLQLLYLNFTAPRSDPEAFAAFMERMRAFLANRDANPAAAFSDEVTTTLYQDNLRRQPLKLEQLAKMDRERADAVFKDRIRDGGDFTFVLVGNFEPEAIRPLVETYLGGIPAEGRKESFKDLGIRRAPGRTRVEVKKGLEPSAQVLLQFHGDAPWSRQQYQAMDTMVEILENRLRTQLREELSATYGVHVSGNLARRPRETYSVNIAFGCAPENVERLIGTVFSEAEKLEAEGPTPTELADAQEAELRSRETAIKENRFWVAILSTYLSYGDDLRQILDYESLVRGVTAEQVKEAA